MNLEQLTKHQIVLLTLLVSFVSSVTTGIVTVSLMGQNPPGITKVVNQIVEHTVEKVVPTTQGATPATATVTEKTVVVKDDDLTAQSIASVQKGIARIVRQGGNELLARAVILDATGTAITDRVALIGEDSLEAVLFSGERVPVSVMRSASTSPIAVVQVHVGTSTGFAPVHLGDSSKLALGQSVIRIGGQKGDAVASGVIAMLPDAGGASIEASVASMTPGSLLITLFGDVVGITTAQSAGQGSDYYTLPSTLPAPTETKPIPTS